MNIFTIDPVLGRFKELVGLHKGVPVRFRLHWRAVVIEFGPDHVKCNLLCFCTEILQLGKEGCGEGDPLPSQTIQEDRQFLLFCNFVLGCRQVDEEFLSPYRPVSGEVVWIQRRNLAGPFLIWLINEIVLRVANWISAVNGYTCSGRIESYRQCQEDRLDILNTQRYLKR